MIPATAVHIGWLAGAMLLANAAAPRTPVDRTVRQDSVTILRAAQRDLRNAQYDISRVLGGMPYWTTDFACEKSVWPFCFGPLNGRVPYAWRGAQPVAFRTADELVPKFLQGRVHLLLDRMLRTLDRAQQRIPGDAWLAGQRVFQRTQAGRFEDAAAAALECRSVTWWCSALAGFTAYLQPADSGAFANADSAFEAMLGQMPTETRCSWENLEDLVWEDPQRPWYSELTCAERREANRRLWWLADPLYIVAGNERRTEHFYRMVLLELYRGATTDVAALSDDAVAPLVMGTATLERQLLQFGAFASILRSLGEPRYVMSENSSDPVPDMLLQYEQPTYHFLPTLEAVRAPRLAPDDAWNIADIDAIERYHPPYHVFRELRYQVAHFRRGDSSRLVAGVNVAADSVLRGSSRKLRGAAMILTSSPDGPMRTVYDTIPGREFIFDALVQPESSIVSLEVNVSGVGAGRARLASGPPPMPEQRVAMSDMLLLRGPAYEPASLDSALPDAALSTRLEQGSTRTVFWELYGLDAGDTVTFKLSARNRTSSLGQSLLRVIGASENGGQEITWTEVVSAGGDVSAHHTDIDFTSLFIGRYILELTVTVPGQRPVSVRRPFDVMAPCIPTARRICLPE